MTLKFPIKTNWATHKKYPITEKKNRNICIIILDEKLITWYKNRCLPICLMLSVCIPRMVGRYQRIQYKEKAKALVNSYNEKKIRLQPNE